MCLHRRICSTKYVSLYTYFLHYGYCDHTNQISPALFQKGEQLGPPFLKGVYPERLPNLPAGGQQVVLGRFLPQGGTQQGRVIVTGTLEGKPVRYVADLVIEEDESGNSFVPRLWARRHLDYAVDGAVERDKDRQDHGQKVVVEGRPNSSRQAAKGPRRKEGDGHDHKRR